MLRVLKKIRNLLSEHERWRRNCINLVASENTASEPVRTMQCSDLMNRYAYWEKNDPRDRYYQGNRYIEEIELIAMDLTSQLFNVNFVDIRPVSGLIANLAVVLGLTRAGDLVVEPGRDIGGHRTVAKLTTSEVVNLRVENYPADLSKYNIDLEKTRQMVLESKPRLLTLGASIFLFPHPVKEIKEIANEVKALLLYDASHVLGLIAGGCFQDPIREGADAVVASTHKTFAGPQGGIILSNNAEVMKKLKLCPTLVDSHHPNRIPGLVLALREYQQFSRQYAAQIVRNAQALGNELDKLGFNILYKDLGYTKSHTLLVDVSEYGTGKSVARRLEGVNIITNKMQTPRDIFDKTQEPTGLRIGVQEMTRFGMKEKQMKTIAEFMKRALEEPEKREEIAKEVATFRSRYQKLRYCV